MLLIILCKYLSYCEPFIAAVPVALGVGVAFVFGGVIFPVLLFLLPPPGKEISNPGIYFFLPIFFGAAFFIAEFFIALPFIR